MITRSTLRHLRRLTLASMIAIAGVAGTALAADPSEITEAERLMFMTDHLASLTMPATLHYVTERRGSLQPVIDDHASLTMNASGDTRAAKVDWMSGANRLDLPPVEDIKGNPVLLHFLEREIREMNRLTGGSMNYYRKRIRMALANSAGVETTAIEFNGTKVPARRITIAPYFDDPARSRYERFAERRYTMVFSDSVPGAIFSLTGELRSGDGRSDTGELLWSETVRYERRE